MSDELVDTLAGMDREFGRMRDKRDRLALPLIVGRGMVEIGDVTSYLLRRLAV